MVKSGEDLLKLSVGKKILWVGDDPDNTDDLLVLFEDFSGVSIAGDSTTAIEDGTKHVNSMLGDKIKAAEEILRLRDLCKEHQEKKNVPARAPDPTPATPGA